jgi:hypothetical protein
MRKTVLSLLLNLFLVTAFCVNLQAQNESVASGSPLSNFVTNVSADKTVKDTVVSVWSRNYSLALMR